MRSKFAITFIVGFMIISFASAQQISIESIAGTYQVKRSGETEFFDSSTNYIEIGDSLRTMENSYVNVSFLDGSYTVFGPNGEGVFDEMSGEPETGLFIPFEISDGLIRVNKQNTGSMVSVTTPHIIVNVDSDIIFNISNDKTTIYVIEGSANILELNLLPIFRIDQGNMLVVSGGSITSPYPYEETEVNQIVNQFDQAPSISLIPSIGDLTDASGPWLYVIIAIIVILIILVVYKLLRRR